MKLLSDYFAEAKAGKWAIGHFNFSTADQLKAITEVARELKLPVMVATSEGEASYIGRRQAVALVKSYQYEGLDIFLNADHHKTFESAKAAIDAGYDSVLIDGSKLSFDENVALTKKVVKYAKSINPDMQIEGELGYLRGSSEIQDSVVISEADYTKPEEASRFVGETGIDRLAIVFGNIHGIVTKQEEHLDIAILKSIVEANSTPYLVLHGASGLPDNEVREAIANGIINVHVNTELRVAYQEAIAQYLRDNPKETTPYKILTPGYEATKKKVREKMELFRNQ